MAQQTPVASAETPSPHAVVVAGPETGNPGYVLSDEEPSPHAMPVAALILSVVALLGVLIMPFYAEDFIARFVGEPATLRGRLRPEIEAVRSELNNFRGTVPQRSELDDLRNRLATLESRLGPAPPALPPMPNTVTADDANAAAATAATAIAPGTTESRLAAAAASLEQQQERLGALDSRLAGLEQDLRNRLAQAVTQSALPADAAGIALNEVRAVQQTVETLNGAVGALDRRIDAVQAAGSADRLTDLENRLTAITQRLATEVTAVNGAMDALRQEVTKASEAAAALTTRLEQSEAEAAGARSGIEQSLAALNPQITALETALQSVTGQVQTVQDRLGPIEARIAEVADARLANQALVLTISALRTATTGDSPFEVELANLRQLLAEAPAPIRSAAESLTLYAPRGVETKTSLTQAFEQVSTQAISADAVGSAGGVFTSIIGAISTIVQIQPLTTGDEPLDDASLTVAQRIGRAEDALARGNLQQAVAALRPIQGPAREALAGWLEAAEGRVTVDRALEQLQIYAIQQVDVAAQDAADTLPGAGADAPLQPVGSDGQ